MHHLHTLRECGRKQSVEQSGQHRPLPQAVPDLVAETSTEEKMIHEDTRNHTNESMLISVHSCDFVGCELSAPVAISNSSN